MAEQQHDYSGEDLELLAALRHVRPDDHKLVAPPDTVWASIASAVAADEADEEAAPVRRRHGWGVKVVALGVAGSFAAASIGAIVVAARSIGDDSVVVARAALTSEGLPTAPSGLTGVAVVNEDADGRTLRVELGDVRPTSGEYLELWLIKPDVSGMVSLGVARADGTYDLPAGLNVEEYPIVDVSTEPYDGDPAHSGDSLVRGVLDA